MSDSSKAALARAGAVIGILTGGVLLYSALGVNPNRVDVVERRLDALESKMETSRELLVRIDENVKQVKEQIKQQR